MTNSPIKIPKEFLKSISITEKVFYHLHNIIKPDLSEREIAKKIREQIKHFGGTKESFRIIVASGKRTSLIHGFATDKKIKMYDIVMLDFGTLFFGFRSDVTRTYVLGKPTKQQNKIYSILIEAQNAAIKKIKPGVACCDIDKAARSIIEKYGYGKYFRHSTGHGIRLKTHESPKINSKNKRKLKPGHIITIEPGIYLNDWGGMRVEDMVLVTNNGYKVLTSVPRTLKLPSK